MIIILWRHLKLSFGCVLGPSSSFSHLLLITFYKEKKTQLFRNSTNWKLLCTLSLVVSAFASSILFSKPSSWASWPIRSVARTSRIVRYCRWMWYASPIFCRTLWISVNVASAPFISKCVTQSQKVNLWTFFSRKLCIIDEYWVKHKKKYYTFVKGFSCCIFEMYKKRNNPDLKREKDLSRPPKKGFFDKLSMHNIQI